MEYLLFAVITVLFSSRLPTYSPINHRLTGLSAMLPPVATSSCRYRIYLLTCAAALLCCLAFRMVINKNYPDIYNKTDSLSGSHHRRGMFTYKSKSIATSPLEVIQYHILDLDDKILSFERILELFSDPSSGLHDFFNSLLRRHFVGDKAYFMECPPISIATMGKDFEFVLIPARAIQNVTANSNPFKEHFIRAKSTDTVISFANIGGDASLVVPCPIIQGGAITMSPIPSQNITTQNISILKNVSNLKNILSYAHLASFIRNSPYSQANSLWYTVAVVMHEKLLALNGDEKIWISTSGLGVAWLHVRLDTIPKYYNWEPYQIS